MILSVSRAVSLFLRSRQCSTCQWIGDSNVVVCGKQCRSGQDEYFQFRFQFRADDEVVFLIGVADVFCTDESSQADAPVNGFQVAGQVL